METHQVRAFLAVAEELHFGRAAARLHVAQPPLSRTIAGLERDLGVRLFDRTTRSVQLTAQGRALLGPAREVMAAVAAAHRAVEYAGRGEVGRVAIGFAGPSSHGIITDLARAVRRRHPGIELALVAATYGTDAIAQLTGSELDLGIVSWPTTPSGMASRVLRRDRYVAVLPADHPLAGRACVALADLADEPQVMLPSASGSSLREAVVRRAHEAGFSPRTVQEAPDTWTATALVGAGVGVTVTLESAFTRLRADGLVVVPLEPADDEPVLRLLWRADNPNPALVRVLELAEATIPSPG